MNAPFASKVTPPGCDGEILVVVHPGTLWTSAKGQVDMGHLRGVRDLLESDIQSARGLVVIDGAFSDAIPHDIHDLIESRLDELEADGRVAMRLWGCDSGEEPYDTWSGRAPDGHAVFGHQTEAALHLAETWLKPATRIVVTGAWATQDGSSGCATSVCQVLGSQLRQATVTVSDHALYEEDMFENQDLDDDDPDDEDDDLELE